MNTTENNKLIAEFMGIIVPSISGDIYAADPNIEVKLRDVKFHSSWGWLMPVIKELKEFLFENIEEDDSMVHGIEDAIWKNDIKEAYELVVASVKLYNLENK